MKQLKTFAAYVVPSVFACALSGIYAIVDGFFVGNSVGDIGLSAINIAYPVTALIQGLGTGIGMGGAVMYSIRRARGEKKLAENNMKSSMMLLLLAAVLCTVLLYLVREPVLRLLGAQGQIFDLGEEYLRYIILGSLFQIFGTGTVPLIRNNGGSVCAMLTMVAGFLTNIVLDYLFVWVFGMGMTGAAVATVIGQAVAMAGGFAYLLWKKVPFWGIPHAFPAASVRILQIGLAPFGITMSPNLTLLLMNRACVSYGGDRAVACYACIAYVITILYLVLQGVGDGCQPLMSQEYGRGEVKSMKKIRSMAYITAAVMGVVCMAVLYLLRGGVGPLFGASAEVSADVAAALPIFLVGILFLAFSRVTTSAFYACEQNAASYLLVYAEPVLLLVLLLLIPRFGGQTGVWWSMALSQILASVLAWGLKIAADGKMKKVFS